MSLSLLNMRQQKFVDEYIGNNGNGRQAAIAAGYSENSAAEMAYENLNKPHIKEAIEQRKRDLNAASKVGIDWRLSILQRAAEAGLETYLTEGGPRYQAISASVSAINELNKMTGAHAAERREVSGVDGEPVRHEVTIKDISDDELAEQMKEMGID